MDIKEKIEQVVETISKDQGLQEQFKKDPVAAVEKLLGVDIPSDVMEKLVAGVKAKLAASQLSGAADALKKLF